MKHYLFYISENYSFQILRPLQKEIQARGDQVKWFIEGDHVNREYLRADEAQLTSIDEVIAFDPCAVFVPGNFVPSFIPGIKVEVFHGFVGWKTRKADNINYHFIIRDCFDLYCTHGPSSTLPFKELAEKHGTFDVIETGWCKMDPYFDKPSAQTRVNEKPVILFSSTFSPKLTKAPILKDKIHELSLKGNYHWLVTFHPKMAQSVIDEYKAIQHQHLTFIESDDLIPVMEQADVMLGDFSSMITDFLLLGKPALTFGNDNFLTGLCNVSSVDDLEQAVSETLARPPEVMKVIEDYRTVTHPYIDGQSSQRLLDGVDSFLNSPPKLKCKPLNLLRNFKIRKKLNYWRLF